MKPIVSFVKWLIRIVGVSGQEGVKLRDQCMGYVCATGSPRLRLYMYTFVMVCF